MSLDKYISEISRNLGRSDRNRILHDSFRGINIIGRNAPIPLNTENHGFTFFTRPTMNMHRENLMVDRVLSTLLAQDPFSVQRSIRAYFDPFAHRRGGAEDGIIAPSVDTRNPFINLLGNNLVSLSGLQDFVINTHTSTPGIYRESYSYVDDIPYNYTTYDFQCTFRNIIGDPITYMMLMWGWYMGLIYEGRIMPYPQFIINRVIDYQTRVYRLITDPSRTYVTRIAAVNAAFPLTAPTGNIFNFSGDGSETPFTTSSEQITVNFRGIGFTQYDYILVYEFNELVRKFNPLMNEEDLERGRRSGGYTSGNMVKLQGHEREYFNYDAFPWIVETTMELEWWVDRVTYERDVSNIVEPFATE